MTLGLVLKIAFGVACFAIGAACLILGICMLPFISASGAAPPGMFVAFAAIFLWIAFFVVTTGALAQRLIQIEGVN